MVGPPSLPPVTKVLPNMLRSPPPKSEKPRRLVLCCAGAGCETLGDCGEPTLAGCFGEGFDATRAAGCCDLGGVRGAMAAAGRTLH